MMNIPARHPAPVWRNIVEAQLRAVGLAIRPVLAVAGALIVVVTVLRDPDMLWKGEGLDALPLMAMLVVLFAPLLPTAVWRGDFDFRRLYLASMPVDRTRHAITKVAAGWAWLMVVSAAFLLSVFVLALITGGSIGVDEMRVLARDLPPGTPPADAEALARRWTTPGWHWIIFFTGPTIGYLLGSAVILASSRTRRWFAGLAVACLFFLIADDQVTEFGTIATRLDGVLEIVIGGKYGLEALFALADAHSVATAAGEIIVWDDPPAVMQWTVATLLWTVPAFAFLIAVVWGDRRD